MDIGEVISDSIKYPSTNWKKVVILGILFMFSFLVVPLFLFYGYVFRAIKASLADVADLPDYEEWVNMLVDGIKLFFVYIIYMLPTIIIGIYTLIMLAFALETHSSLNSLEAITPTLIYSIFGGSVAIGIICAIIYALLVFPIMAVGIGNMAFYNGDLRSAFKLGDIFSIISKLGWVDLLIWYIAIVIIGVAVFVVGSLIAIVPIVGWLLITLLVYPYLYLFLGRALAWLYSSAVAEEYEP